MPADAAPRRRRSASRLLGAREHNLKDIDVEIPLNTLTVRHRRERIRQVDARARRALRGDEARQRRLGSARSARTAGSKGHEFVSDVVLVDQAPIGRTPRSNPVTYLKAFDPIRELFAATKDAKSRGLTASHFSFNVPGGRCEACQGEGEVRVEMQFLADVFVPCEQCDGRRFKPQVLEVRLQGQVDHAGARHDGARSADVLQRARRKCCAGCRCSTRSASAICGWDSRRRRCPAEKRSASRSRRTSPRTAASGCSTSSTSRRPGLHFDDIAKLLAAFRKLLEAGHTLRGHRAQPRRHQDRPTGSSISAPKAATSGGEVVAMGTPEQVAHVPESHTGRFLQEILSSGKR